MSYPTSEPGDAGRTPGPGGETPIAPAHEQVPAGYAPGQAAIPTSVGEPATAPFGTTPAAYAPPLPAAKRGPAVPILLTLTILLFLGTAGMTVLYLGQKSDSDATIARQRTEITALKQDIQTRTDEATKANADLRTTQGRADEATKRADTMQAQLTKLTACQKAVQDFFAAVSKNDDRTAALAVLAIQGSCEGVKVV